ncbi:4-hydroxy-tetrahydrodipicolinate synthase [Thermosediminibacter oceani]|uniref:4-hydroxy-tetrahydrodipicolinate synthase n=1 Tax=Thermosediminibacter oceani (strain ATCC BAA-1034 / DSM 16646 / JW/IW-1228P) TaxID=555079 RepID=D9RYY6_THEOJ|nr:4-hydroxy-tetrahydrodipicolinate synthase [Thermosediminibacter oceani]ADL06814.1 dihydrodipicolinate synthase [Thermosediminibacter oceani DSM 16646]
MDFGRVITAMVTPFDGDLNVDYAAFENLVDHLIKNGSDALVVTGTTGESPTLSDEEKLTLYKLAKEVAGGRAKIIAGTGSYNTRHSIELSLKAQEIGVDGLLLVSPYYNKPTQEGLYQHFKMIAEAVDIPVMLYNVPGRTAVTIEPETLMKLSKVKNIVAVKDAGGNLDKTSKTRLLAPDLTVYSGDDSLTLPMLALGAKGIVSVASHIVGREIKEMIESFEKGDVNRAREIHLKLFDLFKVLFIVTNPIPVKEAMNMIGVKVGGLRPPLTPADEKTKEAIKETLQALGLV